MQASQLDEDPATMDEAEALYRKALELDPWLAIAYTNLGNICFRRGDEKQAEALYRKALELEATQPEAQYNLGYVMLERGHAARGGRVLPRRHRERSALRGCVLQPRDGLRAGREPGKARPCWRKYLEIEPTGTWAEIARKHL